jgi:hypothetical protein
LTRTPDDFPGERVEESILFDSGSNFPSKPGEMLYATGTISGSGFFFNEEGVIAGPFSGMLTSASHASMRQLIHLADGGGPFEGFASGAVLETGPQPFPTASIWWTDVSKTKKIVDKAIVRNQNKTPATITWKSYSTDGTTVLTTVVDTIVYSGAFEISRTRTLS